MRLLVTGSSGYLASLVLPRLAADPEIEEITGLDVRPPAAPPERLRQFQRSVLDPGLAELLAAARIDVVLHLAWVFNPTHRLAEMRRVDVDGSRTLFEAAATAGVAHVVHLSSTTGYGAWPDNPERLHESDAMNGNPDFPYAADKAAVERFLDAFEPRHPGLGVTRLRPCIVLGRATANFVRAILDLPVLFRVAGHDPELQFLHEEDLAECLLKVVKLRPRGAFNLAPEGVVRMSELGPLLGRVSLPVPLAVLRPAVRLLWWLRLFPAPPSYLDFVRYRWVTDVTRMREELGFSPRHDSREAVSRCRTSTPR